MCMKNMKTSIYYFLLIALPLFIISCSKEGPAGPAGPAGPQGTAGAAGAGGPAGPAGTANVIYSGWLDVAFLPDTIMVGNVVVDTAGYYSDLAATKLTNTILSSGDIKVYVNLGTAAAPVVFPLPFLDIYSGLSIDVWYVPQIIKLYSNVNASTQGTGTNKAVQYRYILIPGGTPARVMPDGNAVDARRFQAGVSEPDYRGNSLLWVCPSGPQSCSSRSHQRETRGRFADHGWRFASAHRGTACRTNSRVFQYPRRQFVLVPSAFAVFADADRQGTGDGRFSGCGRS